MAEDLQQKLSELYREAEERDAQKRAEKLGLPYIDLRKIPISLEAVVLIPEEKARQAKAVAVEKKSNNVALVFYNPKTKEAEELINELKLQNLEPKIFIASESSIKEAWRFYEFAPPPKEEITGKIKIGESSLKNLIAKISNLNSLKNEFNQINFNKITTTELFQLILAGALSNSASDIHFEAGEKKSRLRFRIDGVLYDVFDRIPQANYESLITRIKLLSGLKLNVHDEPQDGRFTINISPKEFEVRVSVIPSEFGETVVMRLLDPKSIIVGLENLGLRPDDFSILEKAIKKPNGLILNTGPTGSGKTTTLYAFLQKLNNEEVNIVSLEDPVEYFIAGVNQSQVHPEIGYDFASGLRQILRQDPDIIMVGEIRDVETASLAVQAALTGHIVLSTLHTNNAIGVIPRLIDMKVEPFLLPASLSLMISQRLFGRLCDNCKIAEEAPPQIQEVISNALKDLPEELKSKYKPPYKIYHSKGCSVCKGRGILGRIAIFEVLEMTPQLEKIIISSPTMSKIIEEAKRQKMIFMRQDGILKALEGLVSVEEIIGGTEEF